MYMASKRPETKSRWLISGAQVTRALPVKSIYFLRGKDNTCIAYWDVNFSSIRCSR